MFISQLKMFFVSGSFFITVYFHTQFPGPFFLTQYGRVTDGRTDRHVAIAIIRASTALHHARVKSNTVVGVSMDYSHRLLQDLYSINP